MKLPNLNARINEFADLEWGNVLSYRESNYWFKEDMQGKTGVFKYLKDLKKCFESNRKMSILKITLTGEIYIGRWNDYSLYVGTHIEKIVDTGKFTR